MQGISLAFGLAFASVFDPAQRAAIEAIDKRRETPGPEAEDPAGAPPDVPGESAD